MPRSKKVKHYNEEGKRICGAKVRSRGRKNTGAKCQKSPMANGKCRLHGGNSTGPKNSAAYYKKQILEIGDGHRLAEALDLENPMDLSGEIGLVRSLLVDMERDPLLCYCSTCKRFVQIIATCSHEEEMNENRINDGKPPQAHNVYPKSNDASKMVQATKYLSEIVKNHKEIQKGKEITIRIEVMNLLIAKVVQAYEQSEELPTREQRRIAFVESAEKLLLTGVTEEASQAGHAVAANR